MFRMKTKISTKADLKEEILSMEIRLANDREALKGDLRSAYKQLTLANLIRNTARELAEAPDFKQNVLTAIMSITAGSLSRKLVVGSTHNPIKNIFGALLQAGVTKLVANNSDTLKSVGAGLFKKIFGRKTEPVSEEF